MSEQTGIMAKSRQMMEEYGMIAVGVIVGLFVVEMVVLVGLLRAGVDIQPMVDWFEQTLGWDVSGVMEQAGYLTIAYAITRLLKPFQIALALVLTPFVAQVVRGESGPADE